MSWGPDPLKNLVRVKRERDRLREEYDYWLEAAAANGYSNVKIAHELGLTEAAVRMYRHRKGL